jgi:S-formylglutathione hydrolase FrmB
VRRMQWGVRKRRRSFEVNAVVEGRGGRGAAGAKNVVLVIQASVRGKGSEEKVVVSRGGKAK